MISLGRGNESKRVAGWCNHLNKFSEACLILFVISLQPLMLIHFRSFSWVVFTLSRLENLQDDQPFWQPNEALIGPLASTVAVRDILEVLGPILQKWHFGQETDTTLQYLSLKWMSSTLLINFRHGRYTLICCTYAVPSAIAPNPVCFTKDISMLLASQCNDHVRATRMFFKEFLLRLSKAKTTSGWPH